MITVPRGYASQPDRELKTVGVAYDRSAESGAALPAATALARRAGATLRVIGVLPSLWPAGRISGTSAGYARMLREELQTSMDDAPGFDGLDVERVIKEGDVADELLLVLGSRGYGPLRRVLLGGVSAKVMRSAACPVVVVPRGAVAEAEPSQAVAVVGASN